jgi:hypothetical protein
VKLLDLIVFATMAATGLAAGVSSPKSHGGEQGSARSVELID